MDRYHYWHYSASGCKQCLWFVAETLENYCELVVIDKKSYRKINPPDSKIRTSITVDMEILSIKNIDEMSMTFEAELTIKLKWKDPRLKFKDLKETGNYLEKSLLDQIWLPKLYFVNTKISH